MNMLHRYDDYRWLRGFNIIPSWGARIEQAWWDYEPARFREEAALAVQTHANCIRLWIEFTAWMADPDGVQKSFMDAGYGWMGWGLREGQAVATRRDRFDDNGLNDQGFHAWFNRDGSLRAGLEFLTEPPRYRAPWDIAGSATK